MHQTVKFLVLLALVSTACDEDSTDTDTDTGTGTGTETETESDTAEGDVIPLEAFDGGQAMAFRVMINSYTASNRPWFGMMSPQRQLEPLVDACWLWTDWGKRGELLDGRFPFFDITVGNDRVSEPGGCPDFCWFGTVLAKPGDAVVLAGATGTGPNIPIPMGEVVLHRDLSGETLGSLEWTASGQEDGTVRFSGDGILCNLRDDGSAVLPLGPFIEQASVVRRHGAMVRLFGQDVLVLTEGSVADLVEK